MANCLVAVRARTEPEVWPKVEPSSDTAPCTNEAAALDESSSASAEGSFVAEASPPTAPAEPRFRDVVSVTMTAPRRRWMHILDIPSYTPATVKKDKNECEQQA
jgi:hypothetical protein